MKNFVKKKGVLALCLFGLALVACGGEQDTEYHTTYGDPHQEGYYEYVGQEVEDYVDFENHFVADVDYLIYILENNFPLFNATQRVLDIDLHKLLEEVRESAYRGEISYLNVSLFNALRNFDLGYANFGLLETLSAANVQFHVNHRQRNQWTEVLDNPTTLDFYFSNPRAFELNPAGTGIGGAFPTEILEEGRIALVTIPAVLNNFLIDHHTEELLAFAKTIVDYEHLIIDMTHVSGWEMGWFQQVIIQNLISQPVAYSHNFFSMGGEHTRQFYSMLPHGEAGFVPVTDELLAQFPHLHPDDVGLLHYHYYMQGTINPSDRSVGFDGKIWLLVSSNNIYASDHAASLVQETGFATLVGEPTSGGGITSMFSVPLVLPNTGMVVRFMPLYGVDHLGRNTWEHPTQPDIFNREGMDALQTVLALIEEGDY